MSTGPAIHRHHRRTSSGSSSTESSASRPATTAPGGIEGFFLDFAARPAPELLAEVGLANGIEFIGPPLAVSDPI